MYCGTQCGSTMNFMADMGAVFVCPVHHSSSWWICLVICRAGVSEGRRDGGDPRAAAAAEGQEHTSAELELWDGLVSALALLAF